MYKFFFSGYKDEITVNHCKNNYIIAEQIHNIITIINKEWHHRYSLLKSDNIYVLNCTDNYDNWSVTFNYDMTNNVEVIEAYHNNKHEKAEKFLKKYAQMIMTVCILMYNNVIVFEEN